MGYVNKENSPERCNLDAAICALTLRMTTATTMSATKSGLGVLRKSIPRTIYANNSSSQDAQPANIGAQETLDVLQ